MKQKIINLLNDAIEELDVEQISEILEQPPKPELGDYAFPCFRLAKVMRKAPQMIAQDIADKIPEQDFLERVEVLGAYVNFFTNKTAFAKGVVEKSIVENYGASKEGEGKTICIDYSSPNVAKNFLLLVIHYIRYILNLDIM